MIISKNTDIQNMSEGAIIEAFRGTVTAVMDPRPQSDAQKKFGFHRQSVRLGMGEGQGELWIALSHADMHIPKDWVGKTLIFESTPSEKDGPSGLSVHRYFDKKSERDISSVDVSQYARCYEDTSVPEPVPAPATVPGVVPASQIPSPGSPFKLAHWATFLDFVAGWLPQTHRKAFGDALKTAIAAERDTLPGLAPPAMKQPEQTAGQREAELHHGPEKTELTAFGTPISQMDEKQLLEAIQKTGSYTGQGNKDAEIRDALQASAWRRGLDWEKLYDLFTQSFMEEFGADCVNKAYDTVKARMGISDNAQLCRICLLEKQGENFRGIVEAVKQHMDANPDPAAKDDNAPF